MTTKRKMLGKIRDRAQLGFGLSNPSTYQAVSDFMHEQNKLIESQAKDIEKLRMGIVERWTVKGCDMSKLLLETSPDGEMQ